MPGRPLLLAAVSLALIAASPAAQPTPVGDPAPFWVDPDSAAAVQVRDWEAQGRSDDARLLRLISERSLAVWPSGDESRVGADVARAVRGAGAAGATAVLVAYNIPHRDCGQHSAGGAPDRAAYQRWIGAFADNIGDARAVVVLEPDAVAQMESGCTPGEYHQERQGMLGDAVRRLKQRPGVRVYLDAGNSAWHQDLGLLSRRLWSSGIADADGFAINTANFQTTGDSLRYGRDLAALLGGKHFVVDTGRNGNGPATEGPDPWCNPPGRALGIPPTTATGDPLADAYLWVKRPGDSDGWCRGGPAAGTWWPDYALGLARAAAWNERRTAVARRRR
ncbi:glycoside hydrolase family 6 protein [Streptomyces polyrhachis]|uniref:Glucanase n=1 Tax=Streptomyces polyrhachis TaxID=1282885 RepID=A0ABW2GJ63_9ACTN